MPPVSRSSTIVTASLPSRRVSLKIVEYWTPSRMSLSDAFSPSWPVMIGMASLATPAEVRAWMMPRDRPSYGERTPSGLAPPGYEPESRFSMRACAPSCFHCWIATWLKSDWPEPMVTWPESRNGFRTLIAPS